MKRSKGKVFLVGAGPGDPGLMTVRGQRVLAAADVVVVDALVDPQVFKGLKARVIHVGKRGAGSAAGRSLERSQEAINQLLIRLARPGKKVVRLKGGDPFVFGRGREEVEALQRAGVVCEVIPGVSSVTGVPTFAGIPITDRRFVSQVSFITGQSQEDDDSLSGRVDWGSLSPHQTLVVLMGVGRWPLIRKRLLQEGWPAKKPVAAIEWGATPRQRVLECTLETSARIFQERRLAAPAVIVVGEVVRLRRSASTASAQRPLWGRRVAVTRPLDQSGKIVELLEKQGAEVLAAPAIKIQPLWGGQLASLNKKWRAGRITYDWIIFLSANAVKTFTAICRPRSGAGILAIGRETQRVARELGWHVRKTPKKFNSSGVLTAIGPVRGKRILIPRVQNAPQDLLSSLRKRGARVDEVVTYRTLPTRLSPAMKAELLSGVDGITFTSSSIVRSFLKSFSGAERRRLFQRAAAFSMGPKTSRTLKSSGLKRIMEADNASTEDLVKKISTYFGTPSR